MEQVLEYKIVRGKSCFELEMLVNDLIEKGWKPQGGIAVEVHHMQLTSDNCFYIQSMVKIAR